MPVPPPAYLIAPSYDVVNGSRISMRRGLAIRGQAFWPYTQL